VRPIGARLFGSALRTGVKMNPFKKYSARYSVSHLLLERRTKENFRGMTLVFASLRRGVVLFFAASALKEKM